MPKRMFKRNTAPEAGTLQDDTTPVGTNMGNPNELHIHTFFGGMLKDGGEDLCWEARDYAQRIAPWLPRADCGLKVVNF
ncbi:hypothetical protein Hypma_004227 [Hypsizygus marmoreus]|uniref:Uncharacterized protein n=1 Tax=Hypsizygus marmoreus TaxID=39966 RepID=A0A369J0G6_HYPMA|nr:hypothetical protein Hypma_004227 [Hypsizygus marmoreus]